MTCLVSKKNLISCVTSTTIMIFFSLFFSIWMNKSNLVQNNCLETCTSSIFTVPNLNTVCIDNLFNIKSVDDRLN